MSVSSFRCVMTPASAAKGTPVPVALTLMNNEEYEKAIRCCALDKDLENFLHGDLIEIWQRGLNMSGGQKQRIQLARAVYNDVDIYLLDDPLRAVDAHTAATLFNDCVMAALESKTVILVTHQVEFLSKVDKILVMENGEITQEGTYQELCSLAQRLNSLSILTGTQK